jgi:hypothetical protein
MVECLGLTSNRGVSAAVLVGGTENNARPFIAIRVWLANVLVRNSALAMMTIYILFMDARIALAVSFDYRSSLASPRLPL